MVAFLSKELLMCSLIAWLNVGIKLDYNLWHENTTEERLSLCLWPKSKTPVTDVLTKWMNNESEAVSKPALFKHLVATYVLVHRFKTWGSFHFFEELTNFRTGRYKAELTQPDWPLFVFLVTLTVLCLTMWSGKIPKDWSGMKQLFW